jgi:cysteine-rich repeat protein
MLGMQGESSIRARALGVAALAASAAALSGSCYFETRTNLCDTHDLRCAPGQECAAKQAVCINIGGCGNGVVDPGEVCDDGNIEPMDGCSPDCKTDRACGDGAVGPEEDCDTGGVDSPACDSDCTFVRCGDGHTNRAAEEDCDTDGMITDECVGTVCKFSSCGDRFYNDQAQEVCDTGGDTITCDFDCTSPVCGDGYRNPMTIEQCDDGEVVMGMPTPRDSASCDQDCTPPVCGDGHWNALAEECDPSDLPVNGCAPVSCIAVGMPGECTCG